MFFVIGLFSVSIAYAQEAKVSMNIKNKPINDVFTEIKSQTSYSFWFDVNDLDTKKRVTIEVKDETVKNVLTRVLSGQNVEFKMNGNHIVITKKKPEDRKEPTKPQGEIVIPSVTVTGVVTDINDETLPGVAVFLEGSGFGAFTDIDGKYSLKIPASTSAYAKISFGLLGMKPQKVEFGSRSVINVVMEEDSKKLEDVVVTGYQTINRRDMVGDYTALKAEDIMMPAYSTVDQMLQGQVAGMIVTNSSLRAGTSANINIRGTATLLGNTAPIWVVDGIIQSESSTLGGNSSLFITQDGDPNSLNDFISNQISWLNPNDIESITVLKDASATAIYGSKASNGVIVITTKKGDRERLSVNYTANLSISKRPTYDNYYLMNSQERINFSKEAFDAGVAYNLTPIKQPYTYEGATRMYLDGEITEEEYIQRYNYLETVNTDWLKLLTRDAIGHNHNLSVSGGAKNSSYTASLSYYNEQGLEKGNDNERFAGRLRVNFDISPTVKVDMSLNGSVSTVDAFIGKVNPLSYATTTSRAIPAYDPNGDLLFYQVTGKYTYNPATEDKLTYNIINERDNSYSKFKTPQLNASINLSWQIIPELTYQFVAGYQNSTRNTEMYAGERTHYITQAYRGYAYNSVLPTDLEFKAAVLPFGGQLSNESSQTEGYNVQNKLLFHKEFNKDHRLSGMAAWEVQSTKYLSKFNTIWGFMKDRGEVVVSPTSIDKLEPMGGVPKPVDWGILGGLYSSGGWRSINTTNNFLSAFATMAYSYKNRYVLNANFRNDVSNRFGQDINERFDPTFSFGVLWRLTEEDFMKGTDEWLDNLALKFTYGIQGNALTNKSPELLLIQSKPNTYYGQYYTQISQLSNPNLKWEKTRSWNAGLDLGLLRNKISATFSYYGRNSDPVSNGKATPEAGTKKEIPVNGTHITNHGLEGTININAIDKKDWSFVVNVNLSKNWNKVTKIVMNESEPVNTGHYITGQTNRLLEEDYAIGSFWAYSFAGLDPSTGYPTFNNMGEGASKEYMDFLVYAGNRNPSITGGINLRLRYKNFSLSSQFAAILGAKTFLRNPYERFISGQIPTPYYNLSKELTERWMQPGDDAYTNIPSLYLGSTAISKLDPTGQTKSIYEMWANSDARIVDASFFRCRQISLSWYVNPVFLKTVGVRNMSLSATVNNIFVIASDKFHGMDPELGTSALPKTFSFGLNIGF